MVIDSRYSDPTASLTPNLLVASNLQSTLPTMTLVRRSASTAALLLVFLLSGNDVVKLAEAARGLHTYNWRGFQFLNSYNKSCRRQSQPPGVYGCDFTCPENSCVREGRNCIESIADCECESGYKMHGRECVPLGYQTTPGDDSSAGAGGDSSDSSPADANDDSSDSSPADAKDDSSDSAPPYAKDDSSDSAPPYANDDSSDSAADAKDDSSDSSADDADDSNGDSSDSYTIILPPRPKCVTGSDMYSKGFYVKKYDCNFVCPKHSCVKEDAGSCISGIKDCRCKTDFKKKDGQCIPVGSGDSSDFSDDSDQDTPATCTWNGYSYVNGAWRDDSCRCDDGVWQCSNPPPSIPPATTEPPAQQGCVGNLPFGLDSCVCDGALAGEAAGLAACGRVFNECASTIQAFSVPQQDPLLTAVQRICDSFALDSCLSVSMSAFLNIPGCADILRDGTPRCSPAQARDLFERTVEFQCDPLCKDCVRL